MHNWCPARSFFFTLSSTVVSATVVSACACAGETPITDKLTRMNIYPQMVCIDIVGYVGIKYSYRINVVRCDAYRMKIIKVHIAASIREKLEIALVAKSKGIKQ